MNDNKPVPEFLRKTKSGDFLTTKYGNVILVQRVEVTEKGGVCVYFFFDYCPKDDMFMMNEWLRGFYGPKFDDAEFYRQSTDEEIQHFLGMMKKYGYKLELDYGELIPVPTAECYERNRKLLKDS